ncbi:zinc-binding dehydrogenase, partial [Leptospira borgpetersenii serovar Balcanica]|nr:zinc-binding dehydrogenase [Leptospira borgpetersenii serovar Balcanica]
MSVKAIAVNPNAPESFIEITQPMPQPGEYDLLGEVKAVSINPVATKVHASLKKNGLQEPRVLGWDASGVVTAVGSKVSGFK